MSNSLDQQLAILKTTLTVFGQERKNLERLIAIFREEREKIYAPHLRGSIASTFDRLLEAGAHLNDAILLFGEDQQQLFIQKGQK